MNKISYKYVFYYFVEVNHDNANLLQFFLSSPCFHDDKFLADISPQLTE